MSEAWIQVSTLVAVPLAEAFHVFTDEVDAWWRRGPRFRFRAERDGMLRFEPGKPGRLVEVFDETAGDVVEVGHIHAWEPPARVVFSFRPRAFAPDETTEVEVRFSEEGEATRVTVVHRGFEELRDDHPVRHGMDPRSFHDMQAVWWADQLFALQRLGAAKGAPR